MVSSQSSNTSKERPAETHDLSLLALQAAREIRARQSGQDSGVESITCLLHGLREGADSGNPLESIRSFAPPTIAAFSRALGAYSGHEIETLKDAAKNYSDLMADLSSSISNKDTPHLDRLYKFCLTLHGELLAKRHHILSVRKPRSEYRVQWI